MRAFRGDFVWTERLIERARRLYIEDRMTAKQTADAVGAPSRSSITGMAQRRGWGKGAAPRLWTDERIEQARQLYIVQGLSAKAAGEKLGVTDSSVVGIAMREGWKKRTLRAAPKVARLPPSRPGAKVRKATLAVEPPTARPIRPPTPLREEAPVVGGVQLVDLNASMCRWPIGMPDAPGFHFCGAHRIEPGSYCAKHALKAYQPTSTAKELARSLRRYA